MPELPEVEVLVRALRPLLTNRVIKGVEVRRSRILRPTSPETFKKSTFKARFSGVERRGKYLLFSLRRPGDRQPLVILGHLGMTGRMYLAPRRAPLPKHTALVLNLGREHFIFEDTRYFGRMTIELDAVSRLGPEPLGKDFTADYLRGTLLRSSQPVKVKLLDQSLVAGLGNIYASEALFRARISPRVAARSLRATQIASLWSAIRDVLAEAIRFGSTVPLNFSGVGARDGLFYFGGPPESRGFYEEHLSVYGRAHQPCPTCGSIIKRFLQAGRSTFYCPRCQRSQPA